MGESIKWNFMNIYIKVPTLLKWWNSLALKAPFLIFSTRYDEKLVPKLSGGFCFYRIHHERLEVEPNINSDMDFSKIANNSQEKTKQRDSGRVSTISESKEESFVDDPDVPPLIWPSMLDKQILM